MKKLAKISTNIFLATASVFIAILLVEAFFRLFRPQAIIPRFVENAPYGIRKNLANVRGFHSTKEFKYKINTNSEGFRGQKEYSRKKPFRTFRAVVLGDSVSLGHGVADDETFSFLLENRLEQSKNRRERHEVINMSVSGFGTAEELILLENVAFEFNPDLVILAYFQNDPFNNIASGLFTIGGNGLKRMKGSDEVGIKIRDRLNRIPGYGFLAQHSHTVVFLRRTASRYYKKKISERKGIDLHSQSKASAQEKPQRLTIALLHEFQSRVVERGLSLIIIAIPTKRMTDDFPYNDFKPADNTVVIKMKDYMQRLSKNGQALYYEIDSHPTSLGHEVIAAELEKAVLKLCKNSPPLPE